MEDPFKNQAPSATSPASEGELITPDDAAELSIPTRALYVGQAGDVRVEMLSGTVLTFNNMQGGAIYPIRVTKVLATGTTAANLVGIS